MARPRAPRVAALTIGFGAACTVFSKWMNVVARQTWACSDLMPIVPVIVPGLSPLLQGVAVPLLALHSARRAAKGSLTSDRHSWASVRTAVLAAAAVPPKAAASPRHSAPLEATRGGPAGAGAA